MGETVKVAEAKARFSELQARVEAGEGFVIARGHIPVACLKPLEPMPGFKPGVAAHWKGDPAGAALSRLLAPPAGPENQRSGDAPSLPHGTG